jgi:TolB-like protein/Tfp pilus assembly protein PilF
VLPLENLSGNPEQEYFADGMTEELITSLANLEGVSVISRTSTMQYKGTKKTVPEIARELGVDGVVEGSALRAGDRVRITAQLIDAARDRHVWARSYERDVKEVLALQAEVAAAIAGEIRAALSESGKSRATHTRAVDPQAYEDYLKGRFYWAKRNPDSFRRAEEFFRRAIARDPNYAAPYAGLADVYAVRGDYGGIPPSGIYPIAREAVLRALELDDQLAEAHAALGTIRYKFEHDLAGAGSELRRALALNPSYATAHQWYGGYLAWSGKPSEALAELDRAQELDPLAPVIRWNRANILLNQRRYDEAAAAARQALELDPGAAPAHLSLARIHLASKNYAGALAEFDQSDSINAAIHRDPAIRAALSRGDERAYWSLLLRSAKGRAARSYVSPTTFAGLYARLGERDSALVWLVRAFDGLDAGLFPSIRGLAFDSLRSDPRYVAILKQHGLEP